MWSTEGTVTEEFWAVKFIWKYKTGESEVVRFPPLIPAPGNNMRSSSSSLLLSVHIFPHTIL